jgi:predicted small secreted protein
MLRKVILALTASAIVFGATACNTVRGAGEDVESVANAGSDAIN